MRTNEDGRARLSSAFSYECVSECVHECVLTGRYFRFPTIGEPSPGTTLHQEADMIVTME